MLFQSAPLTEARGDGPRLVVPKDEPDSFNPLPSPKQGETFAGAPIERSKGFNPLPSPKQGEITAPQGVPRFQSAPLTEARGDLHPDRCSPPPRLRVSIRSPHRSKGRHQDGRGLVLIVSIRSPHRSKGRPRSMRHVARLHFGFQSAPLTEARGDAGRYNQRNNKNLHRHMRDSVK